ncbi:MAG TPA: diguanylate cyclase [Acidiferrobacterales bacterium]|nr:diguanylate cyclase [Acidiferrobacterales bacterium]
MISRIQNWLGRTLTRKFSLLLLGFLLLQVAQLVLGVLGVLHLGEEGGFINEAGRQRYRTLLVAVRGEEALAAGKSTAEVTGLRMEMDAYFGRFRIFLDGDRGIEGRAFHNARHDALRAAVAQAEEIWRSELRPLVVVFEGAPPPATRKALARYKALAPVQVARLEAIVTMLEHDVRDNTAGLARFSALLLAVSLLLGVLGLFLARRIVSRPLRHLIDTTKEITAGAYGRRVTVVAHDEIGQLAETFNRMLDAVGEKTERIMALNRVAAAITSSLSVPEIVNQILPHGIDLSGMQAVSLTFYDEHKGQFGESFVNGLSDKFIGQMQFRPGGLADQVFTSGEPVLCSDHAQAVHKLSQSARDEGIRSYLCQPLLSHASRLGVLCFYRTDSETFSAEETSLLSAFARLAAQAIENARLHARTEEMAVTDVLTGLHNRRWLDGRLQEEVQRSQRFGKSLSVLMLDIDHFKRINDQYGHPAGDAVLKRLVEVVADQLREVDIAARYGGEEFVVMFPETEDTAAKHGAERIRQAVASASFALPGGHEIGVTLSIGVACYPSSAAGAEELIARADQALYLAKQVGRNRVVLYRDMLTAEIEKDPNRIVELLREGPQNIQPVVTAVAARAAFYRGHNDAVEQTAARLAEALDLPVAEREALRLASQLHDIGMAVIPEAVLNKKTALTPAEWRQIHQHPAVAAQLLEQVPALRPLAPIVRHHHERWDGDGYPDGLKGEAIPYLARVLAVADAYGSLISDWPGRKAESPDAALAALRAAAGTQLDPLLVERCLQVLETKTP